MHASYYTYSLMCTSLFIYSTCTKAHIEHHQIRLICGIYLQSLQHCTR